jgi:hypothetical protein
VPAVDLEGPDARSIVDGGVLIALDWLSVFFPENHELDVSLDLVTRHLLLVTGRVELAEPRTPGSRFRPLRLRIRDTPASEIVF